MFSFQLMVLFRVIFTVLMLQYLPIISTASTLNHFPLLQELQNVQIWHVHVAGLKSSNMNGDYGHFSFNFHQRNRMKFVHQSHVQWLAEIGNSGNMTLIGSWQQSFPSQHYLHLFQHWNNHQLTWIIVKVISSQNMQIIHSVTTDNLQIPTPLDSDTFPALSFTQTIDGETMESLYSDQEQLQRLDDLEHRIIQTQLQSERVNKKQTDLAKLMNESIFESMPSMDLVLHHWCFVLYHIDHLWFMLRFPLVSCTETEDYKITKVIECTELEFKIKKYFGDTEQKTAKIYGGIVGNEE